MRSGCRVKSDLSPSLQRVLILTTNLEEARLECVCVAMEDTKRKFVPINIILDDSNRGTLADDAPVTASVDDINSVDASSTVPAVGPYDPTSAPPLTSSAPDSAPCPDDRGPVYRSGSVSSIFSPSNTSSSRSPYEILPPFYEDVVPECFVEETAEVFYDDVGGGEHEIEIEIGGEDLGDGRYVDYNANNGQ